ESGSPDLPAYLEALRDRIGSPSLVLCLDSGCLDHERLWVTTSLRGMAAGTLRVDILTEGVHSGEASGAVPSSFRIIRQLLDRLEDSATGRMLLPEL
ncbi:MAG TPA: peptidase M20, partial [Acidimicrobiaceae bacterium]|nr:peptidase M20 [Acidimicrobiaceae bacterium]